MLVHGEQAITIHREIPVEGTVTSVSTIAGIYDKGSGAAVVIEADCTDVATGDLLFSTSMTMFIRGEGGWGGDRGPSGQPQHPARARPRPLGQLPDPRRPGAASTGSSATATRCTPTRSSPSWPASTARSCTACAPTASPAGPCCTRCAAPTRPASARWRAASPRRSTRARSSPSRCGSTAWRVRLPDQRPGRPGRPRRRPPHLRRLSAAQVRRSGRRRRVGVARRRLRLRIRPSTTTRTSTP